MDLGALLAAVNAERLERGRETEAQLAELDRAVYEVYGLSAEDRRLVELELGWRREAEAGQGVEEQGEEDGTSVNEEDAAQESDEDLVARWLSYYVKRVLEADEDGIVPLGATRLEPALVVRVKEAAESDLGKVATAALLSQAPAYLNVASVDDWLGNRFFAWHVAQYQNRPLYWLVTSENFGSDVPELAFRAYIHYLRLTADTLPRLISHYLEPAMDSAHSQLANARLKASGEDGRGKKAASAEIDRWLAATDALRKLKSAVEGVIRGPAQKAKVAANARWLARTIAEVRGGQDVGHGYRPDVDFGVRVNISPLAEARLLPKSTLKKLGG